MRNALKARQATARTLPSGNDMPSGEKQAQGRQKCRAAYATQAADGMATW